MPDGSADLRQYLPGLPTTITREYLDGLSAAEHAALISKWETGVRTLRDEKIAAETTIKQRTLELESLREQARAEHGAATLEELSALLEQQSEACVQLWGAVSKLVEPD